MSKRQKRNLWTSGAMAAALLLAGGALVGQVEPELAPAPPAQADTPLAVVTGGPHRIDYARLDERFRRLVSGKDMVGLSVAVIENGQLRFLKGYGTTTAEGGEPVTVRTVFRWASVSKGVAGTLVGALAQDGKLSLTDPISQYSASLKLPGGAEGQVSVADVLSHRLGIVHNAYDDRLEDGADPRDIRTALGGIDRYCAPGTCHGYQNVAFDAATEVVENVTGQTYSQAVEERLFKPLGMHGASVTRTGLEASSSWARPHKGRREIVLEDAYYRVPAAGGVNSSIMDMALWLRAQMGMVPGVLPAALLDEVHRGRVDVERRRGKFERAMDKARYALGWRDYGYLGHRLVGHRGAVDGYRSLMIFDPATRSGIAMLWNSESIRPVGAQMEVLDMLFAQPAQDWMEVDRTAPASIAQVNNMAAG